MSAAADILTEAFAPPPCPHHQELLALVSARATNEGRTDSLHPGLSFYRHSRESDAMCRHRMTSGAMLAVVLRGRKTAIIEGETLVADPMHYLVVTRETSVENKATPATESMPYLSLALTFPAETIVKALVALSDVGADEPEPEHVPAFVQCTDPAIANALSRLLRAIDDRVERAILAPMIVDEIAVRLLRNDAARAMRRAVATDADIVKVETAMKFMRANTARPLSVAEIARHVGMSESHFAHRFRDVARTSPMRYLRTLRLDGARALMLGEGSRPSEAAARVGFESTSHFTREFKRHFGASPGEYVRRFKA